MKQIKLIFLTLSLLLAVSVPAAKAQDRLELDGDSVWVPGEALLKTASQITANNTQSGFPTSNLLRPESDGVGTNQYIWHTSWGNPAVPPAGTDTYLQVQFDKPQTDIIFSMIGSAWVSTSDTPKEMVILASNSTNGEWVEVEHLVDMNYDFTAYSPERYTSPRIALGEAYTYVRFVVKKTINEGNRSRYDTNGNPFVSLGRFQVYTAVKEAPSPVDKKQNINLLFIGNSITYGAGLSNPAVEAPPAVCRDLIEEATGITTNLYNGGHSGITTLGFLPGRDDLTRLISAAKAFQKNGGNIYISIMLGTNDSAISGPEGAPVSPDNYKKNLKSIIDELISKVPGCKILLNYPIWYSPNTYNGGKYLQEGLDRLRSYYPYLDEIAEEYEQVIAGDRNSWEYFENNNSLFIAESGYSGTFYLHPNVQGAQRLAEVWANSLLDIIVADSITTQVTYRVKDAEGNQLEEFRYIGIEGDTIDKVPANAGKRAYTTYTIDTPIVVEKGKENIVDVIASWKLPFNVSTDMKNAYWYNLTLREGSNYVTSSNSYKCNPNTTKEEAMTYSYQWAFKGDPYKGIVVYNRADTTKTLANVNSKAMLASKVYTWDIEEAVSGFLLANKENGKYINEYGGSGGQLAFWNSSTDVGSIFKVSEVGSMPVTNVTLSTGASIKILNSPAEKANGRAVLIMPGGGYSFIAGSNEGADWSQFFNDLGYTVAVLRYTVPPTSAGGPLKEAREAMKYLRDNGEKFNVTTGIVGVMGFSAGGHLASTVATHTKGDERPAFQILFYPVITMNSTYTHGGSRENLIGSSSAPSLVNQYSNEKQVKAETPMAYICWANDDNIVSPRNSTEYEAALIKNGVPVHTLSFANGGHGFGYSPAFEHHDAIMKDLTEWMNSIDGTLTNIKAPVYNESEDNTYYNMMGVPETAPRRGIYINKKRKVLVK